MNAPENDEDALANADEDLWESHTPEENGEPEIIIDVNSENMSVITESEDESLEDEDGSTSIESVQNAMEIDTENSNSLDEQKSGVQDRSLLEKSTEVSQQVLANNEIRNESLSDKSGSPGMKTVVKIVKKDIKNITSEVTKYLITKDNKMQIHKSKKPEVRHTKIKVIDIDPQNFEDLINIPSDKQSDNTPTIGDSIEKLSSDDKEDPKSSQLAFECLFRDSEKQPIIFDFGETEEGVEIKSGNDREDMPYQPKEDSVKFEENKFIFGCPICTIQCGKQLLDMETINYHMLKSHDEVVCITPVCPLCLYKPHSWTTKSVQYLEERIRNHIENAHPSYCGDDTLIFSVMFNPQMVALKSASFPTYKTTEALYIHIASHKSIIRHKCLCPYCFEKSPNTAMNMSDFISTRSYTDHLRVKHQYEPLIPHFLELLVKCEKGGLNESEKIQVKTLTPVHPLEEPLILDSYEDEIQPQTNLDPSLVHNYAMRAESPGSVSHAETPYLRVCPKVVCPARKSGCDFASWNLKLLNNHIQSHTGEENFTYYYLCSLCLKPFRSIYDGVLHAKNSHPSFMKKRDLNSHESKWGLGKYANENYDTRVNLREFLRNVQIQDDTDFMETYNSYLVMKQLLSESELEPASQPSKKYDKYEVYYTTRNITRKSVSPRLFKEACVNKYAGENPEKIVPVKVEKDRELEETSGLVSLDKKQQGKEEQDDSSDDEIGYQSLDASSLQIMFKASDIPYVKFPKSGVMDLPGIKKEVEDPEYGDVNVLVNSAVKNVQPLEDNTEEEEFEDEEGEEEINGDFILSQEQALEEMEAREKEISEFCGDAYHVVSLHELGFIMMAKPGVGDFGFCVDIASVKMVSLRELLVNKKPEDLRVVQHKALKEREGMLKIKERKKKTLSQEWEPLSSIKLNQGSGYLSTVYFPDERLDIADPENFCIDSVEIAPGIKHSMTNSKLWVIQEAEGAFEREEMSSARRSFILKSVKGSAFSCGIDPEQSRGKENTDNLYRLLPKNYKPPANLNNCTFTEVEGMCVGFQGGIVEHVKIIVKEMADDLCYQCPYCNFVNISVYRIAKHIVKRHQNLTFDHIEVFLKTHTLIICCRHCDFVSFDKLNVWRHFQNFHRVRDYGTGPFIKPRDATREDLKLPQPTRYLKPIFSKEFLKLKKDHYKCPECEQSSEYGEEISKHLVRDHPLSESIRLLHTEIYHLSVEYQPDIGQCFVRKSVRFFCMNCNVMYKTTDEIDVHVYTTHSKGRMLLMCSYCENYFFTRNTMVRHIDRHHSGLERLTCSITYLDCHGLEKLGKRYKKKPVYSMNTDGEELEVDPEEVLECSMSLIRHRVSEKSLKKETYKNRRAHLAVANAKKRKASGSHLLPNNPKKRIKRKRKRRRRRSWGSDQTSTDEDMDVNVELLCDNDDDELFDLEAEANEVEDMLDVVGSNHVIEYDNAEDDIPYSNGMKMLQELNSTTVKTEPADTGYEPQLQLEVKQEFEDSLDSSFTTTMPVSPPAIKQEQPDYVSIEMVDFEALQPVVQLNRVDMQGRRSINVNDIDIKPHILRNLLTGPLI